MEFMMATTDIYMAALKDHKEAVFLTDSNDVEISTPVVGDFYYVYVRLEPNVSLYKHFIEHLWNNMPYFLTYEIRATLSVRSQTP